MPSPMKLFLTSLSTFILLSCIGPCLASAKFGILVVDCGPSEFVTHVFRVNVFVGIPSKYILVLS